LSGLYVYALVGGPAGGVPPEVGLQGEPVRLLDWGGVLAAAGEIAAPPELTRETLQAHDAVVRRLAARVPAILPARFGQWAADAAELASGVAARRAELAAALALVAGCVQMTLRLFSTTPPAREADSHELHAEDAEEAGDAGDAEEAEEAGDAEAAAEAAEAPDAAGPGSRYLADRRRRLAAELPPELRELRRALAPLLRAERLERHAAPPLLATAHDLVASEQVERYRALVAERAAAARHWRAQVSGPWPPYAFAPGLRR
jgi:hypothetical protein